MTLGDKKRAVRETSGSEAAGQKVRSILANIPEFAGPPKPS